MKLKGNKSESTIRMVIGLPGSGKSTYSKNYLLKEYPESVYLSSDDIRIELFGELLQTQNDEVFKLLHKRVKDAIDNNLDVIYDATNRSRKGRMHFINQVARGAKAVEAYFMAIPFEHCLENNNNRDEERVVPEDALKRMYTGIQVPLYYEGFSAIHMVSNLHYITHNTVMDFADAIGGKELLSFENFLELHPYKMFIDGYYQNNPHHNHTLDKHLYLAYKYCFDEGFSTSVRLAAALHDVGKPDCAVVKDNGDTSFYGHQHVSAYIVARLLSRGAINVEAQRFILALISHHMDLYNAETFSSQVKLKNKLRMNIKDVADENVYEALHALHEADLASH